MEKFETRHPPEAAKGLPSLAVGHANRGGVGPASVFLEAFTTSAAPAFAVLEGWVFLLLVVRDFRVRGA